MSYEANAHNAQMAILKELLLAPSAPFSKLQKSTNLTSDHFTFHLQKLVEAGYTRKNDARHYVLTLAGKEYANRMDTDQKVMEKQGKVAVVLIIEDNDGRFIAQKRLKQPYYGFFGRPTGKIRWGETILEAAARELMEETGLEADLAIKGIYHKMDYSRSNGQILEDKYFHIVHGVKPRGEMTKKFEGGENAWMTNEEMLSQEKVFENIVAVTKLVNVDGMHFLEFKHEYEDEEY